MNYFSKLYTRWQHFLYNETLKQKVYSIVFESDTPKGRLFDIILISSIIVSVLMVILESMHLFSPTAYWILRLLEYLLTLFFTIEYLARIYCLKNPRKYIFSFFGLVDLLVIRAFRLIRIFRIFKLFSFISEGNLLLRSLRISAPKISVFFFFVLILVTSMGTVMYMIEGDVPGTEFNNIPNSIYWAIVTMTTVGYGDITPVTPVGRFLSAIIMLTGYTIIAVPTGIVSAAMVSQQKKQAERQCPHCHQTGHDAEAVYCKYCGKELESDSKRKIHNEEF